MGCYCIKIYELEKNMFGLRPDGKKIRKLDPVQKIMPHIMSTRNDSENTCKYEVDCAPLDAFIKKEREKGNHYTYMHLVIAALVRLIALKPRLNRFIMNGRIFDRNELTVSFVVKKALNETATDSLVKLRFTGLENLDDIAKMIDEGIKANSKVEEKNGTDKLAGILTFVPNIVIKGAVGLIKFLDKHGLIPKFILDLSPFHTSFFVTNLKSIKCVYIYHHLYNFGTTGLFVSMGKEEQVAGVDANGNFMPKKVMTLGINTDERFCDGFYFASALRIWRRLFSNPDLLMERLEKTDLKLKPIKQKKKKNNKKNN